MKLRAYLALSAITAVVIGCGGSSGGGEAKIFKIVVNKNATEFEIYLVDNKTKAEKEKIEIEGNRVYWMNEGRDGYLEITQKENYILATDEKTI